MIYNVVIYFVLWGIAIASLFNKKVRTMWRGERDAFNVLKKNVDPLAKYVWFHAASLGEFEQGRPLMERIRKEHPHYKILLTFFSPSGYEVRKNYEGADIICYLPIDTRLNAIRFLRLVRPQMAFFIKYEFWYNYLHILRYRKIPVYSVSSIFRPDQVFFKWYGKSYADVLKCFTRFFVQNEESKKLLAGIGIKEVDVVGDTRFDRVLQIKEAAKQLPICEAFRKGSVFVAGSSWPPDEDIFIPFFNAQKNWRMIIAPHVIGEDHLKQILSKIEGKKVVRYTQTSLEEAAEADVLIIDCFGLLSSIYNYGDVAYVGGGFGVGIHNTLEAAVWNMPVIFGPNNKRFQEAQGLLKSGGGFEINNFEEFDALMRRLMGDSATSASSTSSTSSAKGSSKGQSQFLKSSGKKAGAFVASLSGATGKVLAKVNL